jgi:hypothetical protein
MLARLARSEKVAGELARRRTTGIGSSGETLGHGGDGARAGFVRGSGAAAGGEHG